MDRTLQHYIDLLKLTEIKVKKGSKAYTTTSISEDGKETMLLQTIWGR
jgi:hypothetical protein